MRNDDYFYAGVAIALSVVHGGPGPQFLSPSLFRALATSPKATVISIEEITDPELCINLQRVNSLKSFFVPSCINCLNILLIICFLILVNFQGL